jgi:TonB-linked SusC/RagA family outer membrane protein
MKRLLTTFALLVATAFVALAQRTVTGTVTSDDGETVIGATVSVKGTSSGARTDVNGKYSIAVPAGSNVLVFTYTGYDTKEVTLGPSNVADITMSGNTKLEEVVVTGTAVGTDKRKVAIDVQALGSKSLPAVPSASIDQALVGKIAGAQISNVNGSPGARVSILLRGINTINRGTSPMILIDGVELGATDLNKIDLSIIDRVEVIQGAAAAGIYGAQGANGVIQLFTKRGKAGDLNIDFSTSYAVNDYLNVGDVRKATLHGFNTNANNEVIGGSGNPLAYDNATGTYSENLIWNSTSPTVLMDKPYDKNLKYYDHFDMFFKSAATSNNVLSVSGGSDRFDFLVSGSLNQQESNLLNNGDYKRMNVVSNIGVQLAKGLKFRTVTQLSHTKNTINDGGGRNTIYAAFNTRPFVDYTQKMDDGNYPSNQGGAGGVNGFNPYFIDQYTDTDNRSIDIVQNFNLNYQPFKWLELDAKYGLNYQTQTNRYKIENQTGNPNVLATDYYWTNYIDTKGGELDNQQYSNLFQNLMVAGTFRYDLSAKIKGSTYAGWDYRNRLEKDYVSLTTELPTYTPFTSAQGTSPNIIRDYTTPFVTFGYVVSQHLDFGEFFGVTGGFRSDWSSAFGKGSKPFTFPRGDAYFRISELGFWQNSGINDVLPEFKLRGAFGKAGIQPQPFDRYVTLGTRSVGSNVVFYNTPNQSNPDLGVEVSAEIEVGADFTFNLLQGNWLKSLTIQPTYWTRSTDNAIYDVNGTPSAGISSYKTNAIGLEAKGFQFIAGLQIADSRDFSWRLTTNFGRQTSKIAKLNSPPIPLITGAGSTGYVLEEGVKIGQIFGYVGIHNLDEKDNEGNYYLPEDQWGNYEVASNGWVVNKTSKAPYFSAGQYSFGDPNPTFIMNFINSFTFQKWLTIGVQVDWVNGAHLYNQTKEWMYRDGIHSDYQNPITINGETGAWSAFYRGVYAERSRNGTKSYFYEDASFVRLRQVEIGVNLKQFVNAGFLKRCQVSLSGRNLWTKTKYTGMDPEVNSSNVYNVDSAWDRGTDHNTMPNLRSFVVGLSVGF